MNIYVVRHGQTHWNEQGRMQGAKNSNLTAKGIDEARSLGKYLEDVDFDKVYVSPLGRTLETMDHILGDRQIATEKLDQLKEMNFGSFEGKVLAELRQDYPEEMEKLWTRPADYRSDTGEDYEMVFDRVKSALDHIAQSGEENILLVSHGVIISVILSLVKGKPVGELWDTPVVRNTSLSILKYDGNFSIVKEDLVEHLDQ